MDKHEPQVVRDGTTAADLIFFRGVVTWATKWQGEDAQYLMREDPTRGYALPREKNPRRPVADEERFQRVLAAAPEVQMAVGCGGARRWVRSYLTEILIIVNGTGRRINSILHLRYVNLRLDQKPCGAIHWPADTDKTGKEWLVPISKDVRVAIDTILQQRPGIGAAFIFPSVNDASKPLAGDVASSWLMKAESLAKLPKQGRPESESGQTHVQSGDESGEWPQEETRPAGKSNSHEHFFDSKGSKL